LINYSDIIAMSTSSYAGYSLPVALEHIASCGFKQVEIAAISGQVEHVSDDKFNEKNANRITQYLNDLDLKNTAFSGHIFLSDLDAVEKFKPRMDFTKLIGASIINTKAGQPEQKKQFYKNIEDLVTYAEKIKINIGLETSNDIIKNGKNALEVIKYISSPNLILTYDCGNVFVTSDGKIDPAVEFQDIFLDIGHIHIKEVIREGERWRMTTVGQGEVNYKKIFSVMRNNRKIVSTTIELPFCIKMHEWKGIEIIRKPKKLKEIDQILKNSLIYVKSHLLAP
jgi:sugar phosphate isomerase/epimerase